MMDPVNDLPRRGVARWADMALARMEAAIARHLGMDLESDGSVRVHGLDEPRRTVDLIAPFGPVAHRVQLLRGRPDEILAFYRVYAATLSRLGNKADGFDGQVEAFEAAARATPEPCRPALRRVA